MLYTRKGDHGDTTHLKTPKGTRAPKTDPLSEALGTLDELNSLLGLARSQALGNSKSLASLIEKVQQDLFIIQAQLAGAPKELGEEKIQWMEEIIDGIEKELPPITTFFLPGATELGAWLDYARAVSRRAERRVLSCQSTKYELPTTTKSYLNRLSSLLYALARQENQRRGRVEQPPPYE